MRSTSLRDYTTSLLWLALGGVLVAVTTRLSLSRAIFLVFGIGFLIVALVWPPVILPIIAFAVPFGPALPLGGFSIGATDALIGLLAGIWLLRGLVHRDIHWPRSPFLWPLLLYLVTLLISLNNAWSLRAALPELAKWVEVLILYVVLSALLEEWKENVSPSFAFTGIAFVAFFLVLAAIAEALLGLAQFFLRLGPPGFIILGRFLRAYGTFAQPNPYAGYLGLVLPLTVSLALDTLSRLLPALRGRLHLTLRDVVGLLFYPVGAGIIGLGLLASWSRGGWLGMLGGLGTVIVLRSRKAAIFSILLLFLLISGIVLGAIGAMPAVVSERFQGVQDWTLFLRPVELRTVKVTGANFALVERMAHWWAAYAMWREHPITGVGVGNYPVAYEAYRMPGWKEPLGHAHNIILNVLAETGLVGLVGYTLLWSWVFIYGLWRLRNTRGMQRAVLVGALGGLTHLTIHNLFDNLYVHGMYAYVAILLALITFVPEREEKAVRAEAL